MILTDVNILVYAFNRSVPEHEPTQTWLVEALRGREEIALVDAVLAGFLRIVTNSKIMTHAAPTTEAFGFLDPILTARNTRWLSSDQSTWALLRSWAKADPAIRANRISDAYLAAIAVTNGARLATADRGFARYPRLRWFDPRISS